MQARHTVKLSMNRDCLKMQARGDGWPKWHKELMVAAVRAASIRRQVRPPADLATGVFRLSRRIIAVPKIMRRQVAKKKSRAMERGASHSSSRTVLFRHCSLLGGAHCSGRHGWQITGSKEEKKHSLKKTWDIKAGQQLCPLLVELRFTSPSLKLKVKHTAFAGNHIIYDLLLFNIVALVLFFQVVWLQRQNVHSAPPIGQFYTQQCNGALLQRGSLCSLEEILNS